jgi:hypothetical protein
MFLLWSFRAQTVPGSFFKKTYWRWIVSSRCSLRAILLLSGKTCLQSNSDQQRHSYSSLVTTLLWGEAAHPFCLSMVMSLELNVTSSSDTPQSSSTLAIRLKSGRWRNVVVTCTSRATDVEKNENFSNLVGFLGLATIVSEYACLSYKGNLQQHIMRYCSVRVKFELFLRRDPVPSKDVRYVGPAMGIVNQHLNSWSVEALMVNKSTFTAKHFKIVTLWSLG